MPALDQESFVGEAQIQVYFCCMKVMIINIIVRFRYIYKKSTSVHSYIENHLHKAKCIRKLFSFIELIWQVPPSIFFGVPLNQFLSLLLISYFIISVVTSVVWTYHWPGELTNSWFLMTWAHPRHFCGCFLKSTDQSQARNFVCARIPSFW